MTTSRLLSRRNVIQIMSLLPYSGGGEYRQFNVMTPLSPLGEAAGACHTPFLSRRRYTVFVFLKAQSFWQHMGSLNSLRPQPCHFNYSPHWLPTEAPGVHAATDSSTLLQAHRPHSSCHSSQEAGAGGQGLAAGHPCYQSRPQSFKEVQVQHLSRQRTTYGLLLFRDDFCPGGFIRTIARDRWPRETGAEQGIAGVVLMGAERGSSGRGHVPRAWRAC